VHLTASIPFASLLVAALGLLQCSAGPPPHREVILRQGDSALTLVNRSALSTEEEALRKERDSGLKVIPDSSMQALVERLEELGFSKHAKDRPDPRAPTLLTLQTDGKTRTLHSSREGLQSWLGCIQAFNLSYSQNTDFRSGGNITPEDLERQRQRLQRDARIRREVLTETPKEPKK
jgi:hypothetical protein